MATQYVYDFSEGGGLGRELLGGKGVGLAEMTAIGLPVPAGFTVTTEACREYMRLGGSVPEGLSGQVADAVAGWRRRAGKRFGDPADPLLVSVRSGAAISMPGMMDTILNLGLNDEAVEGLARATGNDRFAFDAYRRLVQMFGDVVAGVDGQLFERELTAMKVERGVAQDVDLGADDLRELTRRFLEIYAEHADAPFPQDAREQLERSLGAVFDSWDTPRAQVYRRANGIPDDLGTAVNVVQMVFGNRGDGSGTGVAFTRDPSTGEPGLWGEFLVNAQGEDVVAGIRTPEPIAAMAERFPAAYEQLVDTMARLEEHYREMQDIEFTVEEGTLYILQTRTGKRTAAAALRIAVDMVSEGLLTQEEAVARIDPGQLDQLLHPMIDPGADYEVAARGLNASPGAATGQDRPRRRPCPGAGQSGRGGRPRPHRDDAGRHPRDHRGARRPDRARRDDLARSGRRPRDGEAVRVRVRGAHHRPRRAAHPPRRPGAGRGRRAHDRRRHRRRDRRRGGARPAADRRELRDAARLGGRRARRLRVRANADTPEDAAKAREFGAEGIGLCRTEHMFMAEDRLAVVQAMILASSEEERREALDRLLPLQQGDFEGIFEAMAGLPVTIRLLDPPLHEFLPPLEEATSDEMARRIRALREANPMLGTRGCRLGLMYPEIYEMQVRAIVRAALAVAERTGEPPLVEIMHPLVGFAEELRRLRRLTLDTASAELEQASKGLEYHVGTMIELPRACVRADEIAAEADFFSFGTNDLTQTTLGFSRDDAEGKFLTRYLEDRILDTNPFETLDVSGVGDLMRIAVERARGVDPEIKLGICGEHGGDPKSVAFCHELGLAYVSCSPFRVPLARLAAAQAALAERGVTAVQVGG